jgi:hypothetical protein
LKEVKTIIKHIETNKMNESGYTQESNLDLSFLPLLHQKCCEIVQIQDDIGNYMSPWKFDAAGSISEPSKGDQLIDKLEYMSSWNFVAADLRSELSKGDQLIDKLEQEMKQTCIFINERCRPFFAASSVGLSEPTNSRLDAPSDLNATNRLRVTQDWVSYPKSGAHPLENPRRKRSNVSPPANLPQNIENLCKLIGDYQSKIDDESYIKSLRDVTTSHREVIIKYEAYQPISEEYGEAVEKHIRMQAELENCETMRSQALSEGKVGLANYNLMLRVWIQEGKVNIPMNQPLTAEVILSMIDEEAPLPED